MPLTSLTFRENIFLFKRHFYLLFYIGAYLMQGEAKEQEDSQKHPVAGGCMVDVW